MIGFPARLYCLGGRTQKGALFTLHRPQFINALGIGVKVLARNFKACRVERRRHLCQTGNVHLRRDGMQQA